MASEHFKHLIIKWNNKKENIDKLQENLKPIQKKIKMLKDESELMEEKLVNYIQKKNLEKNTFSINDLTISCKESSRSESISKEFINKKLLIYFNNDKERVKDIIDFLYSSRKINKKITLNRKKL